MLRSVCRLILVLILLAVPRTLLSQPAFLVEDVNVTGNTQSSDGPPGTFAVLGTTLFFVHDDGIHGYEIWRSDGTEAGTMILADLCPGICSGPYYLTASNGLLFFFADDGAHGTELWKSDGTVAGTSLVKDIRPGRLDVSYVNAPRGLLDAGGVVYFAADDGEHGLELWKSDGTPEGTVLVRDVHPGPNGSAPRPWVAANGALLFSADDGAHGREPWVSDGTTAGTVLAKDVHSGAGSSMFHTSGQYEDDRQGAIAAPGGGFLFQANDGLTGYELWKTEGTAAGTVLVKDIASEDSRPSDFAVLGTVTYFSAADDVKGRELWKTDGTAAGTTRVKDIYPGPGSSSPVGITASGSRIFFRAHDEPHGGELWASDGTEAGTFLVEDIRPGFVSGLWFYGYGITPFEGGVLFFAQGGLWRSDGTELGTDSVPGPQASAAGEFLRGTWALAGSSFFFSTFNGLEGSGFPAMLWKSDGNSSVPVPIETGAPWSLHPEHRIITGMDKSFAAQGGRLLFTAEQGNAPYSLWASDATPAGTSMISSSTSFNLTPAGGRTFLVLGSHLAATDGTAAGIQVLPKTYFPSGEIVPFGSSVLYTCTSSPGFPDVPPTLCKSDGTLAGTGLLAQTPIEYPLFQLKTSGGNAFFLAGDADTGAELWKSDGTEEGTELVRDISPAGGSYPDRLTDVAGILFFSATTPGEGRELWKSNGTEAGTILVKDVQPGPGSSIRRTGEETGTFDWGGATAGVGTRLFFIADDGVSGIELWTSDGTEAGTVLVEDVRPGPLGSEPFELTRVGNRIIFSADDGVHGRELWVSDGTAAGTRMVADLLPGERGSLPQNLRAVGHVLLFAATDGVHGLEAWRSNGTAAGTRMIQDIAPGALPSSPETFTSAGSHVFFAANDGVTGMEPWAVPRSNVLATFGDVPADFWAWPYVEALAGAGLTSGCSPGQFCPGANVSRAETAVFLLRGLHGLDFVPSPATGTVFQDVPTGYWAAPWIERLAQDGFTSGCSQAPPMYCPAQPLNRAEAAVFLLRAKHGNAYTPPPATGTVFADVPAGYWAAPWIEQLAAEGITTGCAPGAYCPGDPVTRAQMAVFLTRAFDLPLP